MNKLNPEIMRKKLADAAKERKLRMPQVQLLLAQERFLARLGTMKEGKLFIWKGGSLVLRKYSPLTPPRFTVDIDLLSLGIKIAAVNEVFQRACAIDLEDGFVFSGITTTPMERDTPYGGERFEIGWTFSKKPQSEPLRIDVCAGDDVDPLRASSDELFIFSEMGQAITFLVYPAEYIFAEKLETVVRFRTGNTRLKDFIDLWGLIQLKPDQQKTASAIKRCFARRKTPLNPEQWKKILGDQLFIETMDKFRERKYSQLELPETARMFSEIVTFLTKLPGF